MIPSNLLIHNYCQNVNKIDRMLGQIFTAVIDQKMEYHKPRTHIFDPENKSTGMEKVNLSEKLSLFQETYVPKIVGELNGQYVKVVKFKGPYVMHSHEQEDEMFLVLKGSFEMEYAEGSVTISEGEFVIVPRGVEHRPNATKEVEVLLFEPKDTLNTGKTGGEFTIQPESLDKI